jgi:hypothetical protein
MFRLINDSFRLHILRMETTTSRLLQSIRADLCFERVRKGSMPVIAMLQRVAQAVQHLGYQTILGIFIV